MGIYKLINTSPVWGNSNCPFWGNSISCTLFKISNDSRVNRFKERFKNEENILSTQNIPETFTRCD